MAPRAGNWGLWGSYLLPITRYPCCTKLELSHSHVVTRLGRGMAIAKDTMGLPSRKRP